MMPPHLRQDEDTITEIEPEVTDAEAHDEEPPYRILIHNDDYTTFQFVISVLCAIFKLSRELAEHIALTAHLQGIALVMVRPRPEAERLVARAHMAARLEGFPLTFSIEPV